MSETKFPSISSIAQGPRQSNIELLRILSMFFVVALHSNFYALGEPVAHDFDINPLSSWTRTFFESLAIVAVNVFVLISGWFGIKASVKGFAKFGFQCIFFSSLIYIAQLIAGSANISPKGIAEIIYITPIHFWFIKAYIGLYILAPVLNSFIEKATKRQLEYFLCFFFVFQTVWGWTKSATFIELGYSTFSFIGLYILSQYARKYLFKYSHIGLIVTSIINTLLYYILNAHGHGPQIYAYVNPLIVIGSLGLILYFNQLQIPYNKAINWGGAIVFRCIPASWEFLHNERTDIYKYCQSHL